MPGRARRMGSRRRWRAAGPEKEQRCPFECILLSPPKNTPASKSRPAVLRRGHHKSQDHLLTAVPEAFAQRCETMKWPPTEACAQRGSFLRACTQAVREI